MLFDDVHEFLKNCFLCDKETFYCYLSETECIADGLLNFDGTLVMSSLFEAVAAFMFSLTLWRSNVKVEVYLWSLSAYCQ